MFHGVQGGQFFQKAPPWPPEAKMKIKILAGHLKIDNMLNFNP
jgi:hypothetical protein